MLTSSYKPLLRKVLGCQVGKKKKKKICWGRINTSMDGFFTTWQPKTLAKDYCAQQIADDIKQMFLNLLCAFCFQDQGRAADLGLQEIIH